MLTPGAPLGLLTNLVQTLAGVLLPSATVFLLLLCNDREVLGPWVNGRWTNAFTAVVIAALVALSIILTASVLWPAIDERGIVGILVASVAVGIALALGARAWQRASGEQRIVLPVVDIARRPTWRMPPLDRLQPARMSISGRVWMFALRGYLAVAATMLAWKLIALGVQGH